MDVGEFGFILKNEVQQLGDITYAVLINEITSQRNITTERFLPPGVDAAPLPGDFSLLVPVQRAGGAASAGVIDVTNEPVAAGGEYRTYARSADGTVVSEVWQRGDGTVEVRNDNANVVLSQDGTITASNEGVSVTIAPDGTVTLEATQINISAAGVSIDCPETNFTGIVYAENVIATDGNVSLNSHITTNVTPGVGVSGPPETS